MRISDWSSDVCSSDLREQQHRARVQSLDARDAVGSDAAERAGKQRQQAKASGGQTSLPQRQVETVDVVAGSNAMHEQLDAEAAAVGHEQHRSEEHTSELQSLMRI